MNNLDHLQKIYTQLNSAKGFASFNLLMTPMSLSYRNQSIDLRNKSIDWFLYEKDIGR